MKAIILTIAAMLGTAVLLVIIIAIWSLNFFFEHGGTLGGFGASSEEYYSAPAGSEAFGYFLVGAAVVIDVAIGVVTYRHLRAKSKQPRA